MTGPLRSIHPAAVQLPDGTRLLRVRAVIWPDRLDVWEAPGPLPVLTHTIPATGLTLADPAHPNSALAHTVHTTDGAATVTRMLGSCGCHSPLAGMRL